MNKNIVGKLLTIVIIGFFTGSCEDSGNCPDDHICIGGNEISYQKDANSQKITISFPPNAVYGNTKVLFNNIQFVRGTNCPYEFFAQSYFNIEPIETELIKLGNMKIEYLSDFSFPPKNQETDLNLYFIDKYNNWSKMNLCIHDLLNRNVSANFQKFGKYAIAYPGSCLVGDWWTASYDLNMEINANGSGTRQMNYDTGDSIVSAIASFNWEKNDDYIYFNYTDLVYSNLSHNYSDILDSIHYSCEDSISFKNLIWFRN